MREIGAKRSESRLESLREHVFALLFELGSGLKESFCETLVIETVFHLEYLLLFFAPWMEFPYHQEVIGEFLVQVVEYIGIAPATRSSYSSFTILFYFFSSLDIAVAILLLLLHFLRGQRSLMIYEWILSLLQTFFKWVFHPFYIPLLAQKLLVFKCRAGQSSAVHDFFPDVTCFSYPHWQHLIFAGFSVIFQLAITAVYVTCCYEHRKGSGCTAARESGYYRASTMLLAVPPMVLWALGASPWVSAVYFLLSGTTQLVFLSRGPKTFYNEGVATLAHILFGYTLWCSIMPFLSLVLDLMSQRDILIFWLVGLPLIAYIFESMHTRTLPQLKRDEICSDPSQMIEYAKNLLHHLSSESRDSSMTLRGLALSNHNEYPEMQNSMNKLPVAAEKSDKQFYSISQKLFVSQLNMLFAQCTRKFKRHVALRLEYARFLLEDCKNQQQQALDELYQTPTDSASLPQQFHIYRYKRLIKESYLMGDSSINGSQGRDQTGKFIEYERELTKFKHKLEKTARCKIELTGILMDPYPDADRVYALGCRILEKQSEVERIWEYLSEMRPDDIETLTLYSQYYLLVQHDQEGFKLFHKKAKEYLDIQNLGAHSAGAEQGKEREGVTATVTVSGSEDRIGVILACNVSFCKLFGYPKVKLVGSTVEMLMPRLFGRMHRDLMLKHVESQSSDNFEVFVVAQHHSGYIFPAWIRVTPHLDLADGNIYVASVITERKHVSGSIAYALLNAKHQIVNVSSNAISFLQISNEVLANTSIHLQSLAPDLFSSGIINLQFFGEGSKVRYFAPDYERLKQQTTLFYDVETMPLAPCFETTNEIEEVRVEGLDKSDRFKEYHCQAIELSMKQHGNVGTLVCFEKREKMASIPQKTDLSRHSEGPLKSVFMYNYEHNKYIHNTVRQEENLEEMISRSEVFTKLEMGTMDEESRRYSLYLHSPDLNQSAAQSSFVPDTMKRKNNFYAKLISSFQIDRAPKEYYGNIHDILIKNSLKDYGRNVLISRLYPDGSQEDVDEEIGEQHFEEKLKVEEDAEGLQRQRRNMEDGLMLGSIEIEDKKGLENSMQKVLNYGLLKLSGIVLGLVLCGIILCFSLKFVYFENQFNALTGSLETAQFQSQILPNTLYAYSHVWDIATCNEAAGQVGLCAQTSYNPAASEKHEEVTTLINDLMEVMKKLEHTSLKDPGTISVCYDEYNSCITENLKNTVNNIIQALYHLKQVTELSQITLNNNDAQVIITNTLNDFGAKLLRSMDLLLGDILDFNSMNSAINSLTVILFVFPSLFGLALVYLFRRITANQEEVLSLLLEVPDQAFLMMNQQCEKFIANSITQKGNDEESASGCSVDAEEVYESIDFEREGARDKRRFRRTAWRLISFFAVCLVLIALVEMLILIEYWISNSLSSDLGELDLLINGTSNIEMGTIRILIAELVFMHNASTQVWELPANQSFPMMLDNVYEMDKKIELVYTVEEYGTLGEKIQQIIRGDLCEYYSQLISSQDCAVIANGCAKTGLGAVLYYFYEGIRREYTNYALNTANVTWDQKVDWPELFELRKVQSVFIKHGIREVVEYLGQIASSLYRDNRSSRTTILIVLVAFVVVCCGVLFLPYLMSLKRSLQRTNELLLLLPQKIITTVRPIRSYILTHWLRKDQ